MENVAPTLLLQALDVVGYYQTAANAAHLMHDRLLVPYLEATFRR